MIQNDYYFFAAGILGFAGFLGVTEIISRQFSLSPELTRRLSHISAAIFTVYFSLQLPATLLLAGLAIFTVCMFISRLLKIFRHIHSVSRITIGEELLPLGFIASYVIAWGKTGVFVPSVLLVGLADPIAGIFFDKYKKGFLKIAVFMLIAFITLIVFSHLSIAQSLIIACIVSFVEKYSPYGTDNLSIPVSTAILLTIL